MGNLERSGKLYTSPQADQIVRMIVPAAASVGEI